MATRTQDIVSPHSGETSGDGDGRRAAARPAPALSDIVIRGAREHNLQNLSLRLPRQRLIVITGVSGSG
jgi:hypothetical protein